MVWHFRLSQRDHFLRNERYLNNLSPISKIYYPLGVIKEVFIGKILKSLDFGRFLNWNYVKNLTWTKWPLKPTLGPLERLGRLMEWKLWYYEEHRFFFNFRGIGYYYCYLKRFIFIYIKLPLKPSVSAIEITARPFPTKNLLLPHYVCIFCLVS